jgi:hypothetical protein
MRPRPRLRQRLERRNAAAEAEEAAAAETKAALETKALEVPPKLVKNYSNLCNASFAFLPSRRRPG